MKILTEIKEFLEKMRSNLIMRPRATSRIDAVFEAHPAVALVGPRQCGKTTLSKMITRDKSNVSYFDLEDPVDLRKLQLTKQALMQLSGVVVIDEIQRQPKLLEVLRVVLDDPNCAARFLILGSASPTLIKGASESLAGRIGFVNLAGFTFGETAEASWQKLWQRGGFPPSYLATNQNASLKWRANFIRTFLERDIPQLGISIASETLRRFWTMVAHYHGQIWNSAEFARSLGSGEATARRYLDILSGAFMVRILPPWYANLKKRQVRAPKIYLRDTGILHALLGIDSFDTLRGHPKVGASFEGFAIEQVIDCLDTESTYFWATHAGAELDLLFTIAGKQYGIECKYSDAPGTTRSMRVAIKDLRLEHLWIIYPGTENYRLDSRISAVSIESVTGLIAALKSGNEFDIK